MAKTEFTLNNTFESELLEVTKNFKTKKLNAKESVAYFAKCPAEELQIQIVALDPELTETPVGFPIQQSDEKKGASTSITQNGDTGTLTGTIEGVFTLNLRAGVTSTLVPDTQYAIEGISFKGGSYNGFMAMVKGQSHEDLSNWPMIPPEQVKIK